MQSEDESGSAAAAAAGLGKARRFPSRRAVAPLAAAMTPPIAETGVPAAAHGALPARLAEAGALAPPIVLFLVSLLVYKAARRLLLTAVGLDQEHAFALVVAACLGAAVFVGVRYAAFPRLLRVVLRGIGIVVLVQVLFDAFAPVPPLPNILFGDGPFTLYYRWGAALGVAAGLASLWRPSFLVPLFFFYVGFRHLIGQATGIAVVETDYLNFLDTGIFAIIGGLIVVTATSPWGMERIPGLRALVGEQDPAVLRRRACALVWACVVGAHLGNYFLSGVAKIEAGGDAPLTWWFHNPTQTSIVIGLERGDNPLALWPWAVQMVWDAISRFGLVFNSFVFLAQILAPLAVLSVRALMVFTLLFDMFHVGVYLTLGALFHFWILMNLIIYISAWRMREIELTPAMKVVGVLAVLFGHYGFYTNTLGWLDGAKLASPSFVAVTRDGRSVPVPQVYWGIASYSIAQGWMYVPDGHFSFRIGGNNLDPVSWHDATTCGPAIAATQDTGVSIAAVERLVRTTHALMTEHPAIKALNLYYFYPHHMVTHPWLFTEFNRLSIDDIVGYRYVVESVCLSLRDGHLVRDVRKRTEVPIDVRGGT